MDDRTLELRDLKQALREVLADIPDKPLTDFAKQEKLLSGGFRPGKTAVLQEHILMTFGSALPACPDALARFLREQMPLARFLSLLDAKTVETYSKTFMTFFTKPLFLLALLADAREELRTYAADHLKAMEASLPEPDAAEETVKRLFAPLLSLADGTVSARRQNQTEELNKKIEETKQQARADRHRLTNEHAAELRDLKAKLTTAEWSRDEQIRRVTELEGKLRQEEEKRARRVQELLAERQIALFQGWLKPLVTLEQSVAADTAAPLLERAEAALAEQAKLDRAARLVAEQESRLARVTAMLERVETMLRHAQTHHPDLVAVQRDLSAERDALVRTLTPDTHSPFTAEVARRLLTATESDYESALTLLKLGQDLALIPPAEGRALLTDFHRRAARWASGVPEKAKDLIEGPSAIEKRNPALREALLGTQPAMLFFDGHNILNGLGRYRQRRGTAVTHEEGRDRVGRDLVRLLQNLPMTCAHLVWDGTQRATSTLSANVTLHFSGGTGEHRADRYIIDQLTYYRRTNPDLPLILVTDDRDFAGEANRLGAAVCRLHDFEAFLNAPTR